MWLASISLELLIGFDTDTQVGAEGLTATAVTSAKHNQEKCRRCDAWRRVALFGEKDGCIKAKIFPGSPRACRTPWLRSWVVDYMCFGGGCVAFRWWTLIGAVLELSHTYIPLPLAIHSLSPPLLESDTMFTPSSLSIFNLQALIPRDEDEVNCGPGGGVDTFLGLRIASVFVILVCSCFGAFAPVLATRSSAFRLPQSVFEWVHWIYRVHPFPMAL